MKALKNLFAAGMVAGLFVFLSTIARGQFVSIPQEDAPATSSASATVSNGAYRLLHHKVMINSGVIPAAVGTVQATHNKPGIANNQVLNIVAKGLQSNATYQLIARMGDDPYFVQVGAFTADKTGKVALRFLRKDDGIGTVRTNAPGKIALPPLLNPVHDIRQLVIQDSSDQAVLSADFSAPDIFGYAIKRPLSNDGADPDASGLLRVNGNMKQASVRVSAFGLAPNTSYSLVLNSGAYASGISDKYGKLVIVLTIGNPSGILTLRTVSISDSSQTSILSATLP